MAHELEQDEATGRVAMVSGMNISPWHRLGEILPEGLTAGQALEKAYLKGWNIQKVQQFAPLNRITPQGLVTDMTKVPGSFTIVRNNPFTGEEEFLGALVEEIPVKDDSGRIIARDEKIIRPAGQVGMRHTAFQNEDGIEFMEAVTDAYGDAVFETAGSIRGGTQTFVTMRLKNFKVAGRDGHTMYLVYLFNHITGANQVFVTNIRVVCANTVDAAQQQARTKFIHSSGIDDKHYSQEVRDTLKLSFDYNEKFQAQAEQLIQMEMDLQEFRKVCDEIWTPVDRDALEVALRDDPEAEKKKEAALRKESARNKQLKQLFLFSDTQEDTKTADGDTTRWTAYNTLVEYMDHYSAVRAKDPTAKAIRRAENTIDGIPDKEKAYRLLTTS